MLASLVRAALKRRFDAIILCGPSRHQVEKQLALCNSLLGAGITPS